MRKLVVLLFAVCSVAFAADFDAAEESGSVLNGALRGALNPAFSYAEYIAGYGIHFASGSLSFAEGTGEEAIGKITNLLPALASTAQGLNEGEWVSASYDADVHVLVRVKPNQPDSLEVWVDGVRR